MCRIIISYQSQKIISSIVFQYLGRIHPDDFQQLRPDCQQHNDHHQNKNRSKHIRSQRDPVAIFFQPPVHRPVYQRKSDTGGKDQEFQIMQTKDSGNIRQSSSVDFTDSDFLSSPFGIDYTPKALISIQKTASQKIILPSSITLLK